MREIINPLTILRTIRTHVDNYVHTHITTANGEADYRQRVLSIENTDVTKTEIPRIIIVVLRKWNVINIQQCKLLAVWNK